MIRGWFGRGRHERVAARAERGERAWRRDLQQHPDELIAFRDAQIAGLRERNGELEQLLAVARRELATYKTREFMASALRVRARYEAERAAAEEPTVHTRAPGWPANRAASTERWER